MGSGSHGVVYKAQFSNGLVAVVREVRDFQQGKHAFDREVQLLARLHHRHLVTFRGFSTGYDRFSVSFCLIKQISFFLVNVFKSAQIFHLGIVILNSCFESPLSYFRFLVFDYMENGSLKECLHGIL